METLKYNPMEILPEDKKAKILQSLADFLDQADDETWGIFSQNTSQQLHQLGDKYGGDNLQKTRAQASSTEQEELLLHAKSLHRVFFILGFLGASTLEVSRYVGQYSLRTLFGQEVDA